MPVNQRHNAEAVEIIERLGGTSKAAELCEVSPSAVSQWMRNGIPRGQLKFLRLARPDVFLQRNDGAPRGDEPKCT